MAIQALKLKMSEMTLPAVSSGDGSVADTGAGIRKNTVTDARSETNVEVAADQGVGGVGVSCAIPAAINRVAMTTTSVVGTMGTFLPSASYQYPSDVSDTTAKQGSETPRG